MRTPSPLYCRLDLAPPLADQFICGVAPSITARYFSACPSDSTSRWTPCPPEYCKWWLQVRLGCVRLSLSCPFRLLHTFHFLRPATYYRRFWIQRPSSERRRDLNPPDQCAAQRKVHPGRLHSHAAYSALHQPVRHPFHIRCKAIEATDRFRVPLRVDGQPVFTTANVDAGCIGMHHLQRFPVYFRLLCGAAISAFSLLVHNLSYRSNRQSARPGSDNVQNFPTRSHLRLTPQTAINAGDRKKTGATLV